MQSHVSSVDSPSEVTDINRLAQVKPYYVKEQL